MKIYGKNIGSVLRELPWAYQIVVLAGVLFLAFTVVYIPYHAFSSVKKPPRPAAVSISGAGVQTIGFLDPSIAYDPKNRAAWMAYAAQESTSAADSLIHVRLARAVAKCDNWSQTEAGIMAKSDDILAPDGQSVFRSGTWRVETPSLVYDPDDKGREWKLFAYKYFWPTDPSQALQVAQHYGVIVYKTASDPAGQWSSEQWLFSPGPDYPPPPYDQMVAHGLNAMSPELQDVLTYARPSVIYADGILLMSLSAFTGGNTPDRIVMIASRDHGASWQYVGAPLRRADVAALGPYTTLAGASLMLQNGRIYLAAALGDDTMTGRGTFVFAFDDPGHGHLARDAKGVPVLTQKFPLFAATHGPMGGGIATYTDGCAQGMFTSEQTLAGKTFQIFKTYIKPAQQ